jgi:outer membrane protein assembly factor BamD (BamD/ComL family)
MKMLLDFEVRGIQTFPESKYLIPVVKYQIRKLVSKQQQDFIHGGHYYTEGKWTEWEDIPITRDI